MEPSTTSASDGFIDDYHGIKAGLYGGGTAQVTGVVFLVPEKQLAISGLFNLEGIPSPERIALAKVIAIIPQSTPRNLMRPL